MEAMNAHHIFPVHSADIDNIEHLINAGIIVSHGTSIELINKSRAFTFQSAAHGIAELITAANES
jgi:hypothetical protein